MSYTPTIGLEVHAELKTKSKMFCSCANDPHAAAPNTHICPVCMGHPGTLPVPNQAAIESVLLFGRAVGAAQATFSEFDRKNYFYPDIPKAYQISQYAYPFLTGGEIDGIQLTRVHLEEDTARSQHDKGEGSLVDFNRSGVPLMELVTEPVMHDAATVGNFARELQLLLRTLGISDAHMERGEMRVEANISISKEPGTLGTKVEVKNLNSFKAVESAILYEVVRQTELLESGGTIAQETRGWDENKAKTFSQRSKETAKDYRYFPDPDISKIETTLFNDFSSSVLDEKIPVLPNKIRDLYKNLGITNEQIETLLQNQDFNKFFAQVVDLKAPAPLAANYITSDLLALCKDSERAVTQIAPEQFAELMIMLAANEIGSRGAKDLLPRLFEADSNVRDIATMHGLLQVSDDAALESIVSEVLETNEVAVAEYLAGKESALKFLVGQGMKASRGSANPVRLAEILQEKISK